MKYLAISALVLLLSGCAGPATLSAIGAIAGIALTTTKLDIELVDLYKEVRGVPANACPVLTPAETN